MTAIKTARFIKGVVDEEAILYNGIPQIAFIGRSNVGKSSTLNTLLSRRKLVKTGNTPGKTREINFFEITTNALESFYFVDLPGYGYAKLSKKQRGELRNLIEWYLRHPEADTALVCLILDAKVGMSQPDREMIAILESHQKPYIVAVNKIDKINQKKQHELKKEIRNEAGSDTQVFFYSAKTGKNLERLRTYILDGREVNKA